MGTGIVNMDIACCGNDCSLCLRYLATEHESQEWLDQVAYIWKMIGWGKDLESAGGIACHGCASVESCSLGIRECVKEKGLENCGKCDEYPCDKLTAVFEKNKREDWICRKILADEEFSLFRRAFFSKQKRLDEIHKTD